MDLALQEGLLALRDDRLPVGCVIVEDGKVIAKGRRSEGDHATLDHAEMLALRSVVQPPRRSARGLTLYTTLEPCVMCFGAIIHNRVARVVYALEDPYGGAARVDVTHISRHGEGLPIIEGGCGRDSAIPLFRQFFASTKDPFWSTHPENELCRLVNS